MFAVKRYPATPVLATDVIFDVGGRSRLATILMLVTFDGFTRR